MSIFENLPKLDHSTINLASINNKADHGDPQAQYELACHFKSISIDQYVHYLKLAADNGHAKAQYELGCEYDDSLSGACPRSYSMAAYYFKLAAEQGYGLAQTMLGYFYEYGLGVVQSYEKAVHYYHQAGDHSFHCIAYALLAHCYEMGHGVLPSDEKAKYYYGLSLMQTSIYPKTLCSLEKKYFIVTINNLAPQLHCEGKVCNFQNYGYYQEIQFRKDLKNFLLCKANAIILERETDIALLINFYKKGPRKNDAEAIKYTELLAKVSAKKINANANSYDLALHYKNRTESYAKCLYYYYLEKAADDGYAGASLELGKSYERGHYFSPQSDVKAFEYYLKAAQLGHAEAQFITGILFYSGTGTLSSNEMAMKYMKAAADQEHIFALGVLGYWYGDGITTYESKEIANEYFVRCVNCYYDKDQLEILSLNNHRSGLKLFVYTLAQAELGSDDAQCKLADFYRKVGKYESIADDICRAKHYYSLAAEQGNPKAQRWLGLICEFEGNHSEAFKYYALAATQGDAYAFGSLALCYYEGKGTQQCIEEAAYCFEQCEQCKWDRNEFNESSFDWGQVELAIFNKLKHLFKKEEYLVLDQCENFAVVVDKKIDALKVDIPIEELREAIEMRKDILIHSNTLDCINNPSPFMQMWEEIHELEKSKHEAIILRNELREHGIPLSYVPDERRTSSYATCAASLQVAQLGEEVEALYNPQQNSVHPLPNSILFERVSKRSDLYVSIKYENEYTFSIIKLINNNLSQETYDLCCKNFYIRKKAFSIFTEQEKIKNQFICSSTIKALDITNLDSPKIKRNRLRMITFLWLTREC